MRETQSKDMTEKKQDESTNKGELAKNNNSTEKMNTEHEIKKELKPKKRFWDRFLGR